MDRSILLTALVLLTVPLAGCVGNDFVPGENYTPTGNTVHIRMWVADMVQSEIFPGFNANLWAFCAEPADPNDEYSRNAIEYREPSGKVQYLNSAGEFETSEEDTAKCSVPGPQLRVQQGDRVVVDFVNDHFHPHTIHWHGQYVPWTSDGVPGSTQDAVMPSTSFTYDFEAKRAGTMWYHCHVDTQFHVMQGLYGVIIVEPQDRSLEPDVDRDETLVFSNLIRSLVEPDPAQTNPHEKHKHGAVCGVSGIPGCQNPAVTEDADVFMINGVSAPNTFKRDDTLLKINPGETMRIRLLNAGPFTTETIHLHGHDMLVTHIDGNPIPEAARYWVDTVLIGPGQRFDVMVEGREGNEGIWVMHTHITSRVTNSHQYPGGMLTKLVYEDWLEQQGGAITPFDGVEIPGGIPYIQPFDMPDDLYVTETTEGGFTFDQQGPSELARFPLYVEMPCAVQEIWAEVDVNAPAAALLELEAAGINDLTAHFEDYSGNTVVGPVEFTNGTVRMEILDLYDVNYDGSPIEGWETIYQVRDMPMVPGTLQVVIEGSSTDLDFDFTGMVDYYRSREAMQYYSTNFAQRDTCEEVIQPGYVQFPPQNAPPL